MTRALLLVRGGLAILSIAVMCAACAQLPSREDLDVTLARHHIDLRWGRLAEAAGRVSPGLRSEFLHAWSVRLQAIELQDVEVVGVVVGADSSQADVVVAMTYVDRETLRVHSTQMTERWSFQGGGWHATSVALPAWQSASVAPQTDGTTESLP